jgi:hypothetical protein
VAGKIEVIKKYGISKDKRYSNYPYWRLKITSDDGTTIIVTPKYEDLKKMLIDIIKHERQVDIERKRKLESTRWIQWLKELLIELPKLAQCELSDYSKQGDEYRL